MYTPPPTGSVAFSQLHRAERENYYLHRFIHTSAIYDFTDQRLVTIIKVVKEIALHCKITQMHWYFKDNLFTRIIIKQLRNVYNYLYHLRGTDLLSQ